MINTVVEVLANGDAFEVEFSDRSGRIYESLDLLPELVTVLHFELTVSNKNAEMITV